MRFFSALLAFPLPPFLLPTASSCSIFTLRSTLYLCLSPWQLPLPASSPSPSDDRRRVDLWRLYIFLFFFEGSRLPLLTTPPATPPSSSCLYFVWHLVAAYKSNGNKFPFTCGMLEIYRGIACPHHPSSPLECVLTLRHMPRPWPLPLSAAVSRLRRRFSCRWQRRRNKMPE